MGGMISWKSGDGAVAKNRMQRQPQWKQPDVSVLLGHWLHHTGTPGVSTLSKLGVYGFISSTGVLSLASIKVTRIMPLLKSMSKISDVVKAIGFGRAGDLVAKTPITVGAFL